MAYTIGRFTIDDVGFIQTAATRVLVAVVQGELDLNRFAREELVARGLNQDGVWVGSEKTHEVPADIEGTRSS